MREVCQTGDDLIFFYRIHSTPPGIATSTYGGAGPVGYNYTDSLILPHHGPTAGQGSLSASSPGDINCAF